MRTIYKIGGFLVVFILACGNPFRALSHEADSLCVSIYFRRGHATWDPAFRGNNRTLESFAEILKKCQTSDSLHRIRLHLRGNASPDGSGPANARLSGKRAATVLSLLRKQMQLPDSLVSVAGGGNRLERLGCDGRSRFGLPRAERGFAYPSQHPRMDPR